MSTALAPTPVLPVLPESPDSVMSPTASTSPISRATELRDLAEHIRAARGVAHKRDIAAVVAALGDTGSGLEMAVPIGDDCAAWADGEGYLLFAVEGFVNDFVAAEPRFAGYCGVMVNVSDIYAMGGRPLAIVNALWSRGGDAAMPILEGMAEASRIYGVPVVGGHSNRRCDREQLSVAIMGRAKRLLSSFDARPGEHLVAAIDLRGGFHEPFPYWDASTGAPAARLRADLEILPALAEAGHCHAAKDISMAGIVGTAMMFAECSGCGVRIDVDAIPRPASVPLARWLDIFPSYGFLLSASDANLPEVLAAFAARGIPAASIGRFDASHVVSLRGHATEGADTASAHFEEAMVWDFAETPLIGCGPVREASR